MNNRGEKSILRIKRDTHNDGVRLVTERHFACGEPIYKLSGYRETNIATYQTIQISEGGHIFDLDMLAYINHSCRPNTFINTETLTVIAERIILPGEELTFFYPSTEWDMARPFVCQCKVKECLGLISGARYLSPEVLNRYHINRHIIQMAQSETWGHHTGFLK
jgi:hypothetical protein